LFKKVSLSSTHSLSGNTIFFIISFLLSSTPNLYLLPYLFNLSSLFHKIF
jgi:hypothetical protein